MTITIQVPKPTSEELAKRERRHKMGKYKIQTDKLSAWFDNNHVLKEISLSAFENNVTAVIGPSGCGKSTFIRCLNRMHELVPGATSKGKVTLDDIDVYGPGVDPVLLRRRVGMVFQKPNPFPSMSIKENVLA